MLAFQSAAATLAPNFPITGGGPDLGVTFANNNTVSPPGELIPRPETADLPNLTTPVWPSTDTAILLIVDIDVPRNGTRVQLLHLLAANVTRSPDTQSLTVPLPALASYIQPSPPVGDIAHAYTLLLFAQPANFSIPPAFAPVLQTRLPFDTAAFVAATNLGAPVAANYFRVQNTTGSATTTFPPPASTPTNATSGPTPEFPGAAAAVLLRAEAVWLMAMASAVLAGGLSLLL